MNILRYNPSSFILDRNISEMKESDKRSCAKKSKKNPDTKSAKELYQIAQNKYLLSDRELSLAYGFNKEQPKSTLTKSKSKLCKAINDAILYRKNHVFPKIDRILRNDFSDPAHPIHSAPDILKIVFIKEFSQMYTNSRRIPLESHDYTIIYTRQFKELFARISRYEISLLPQNQRNRFTHLMFNLGGFDNPGNNWSPKNGNNVNNLINGGSTLHNHVFSAGNIPTKNKAVYIKENVKNKKIQAVYNVNGLKEWLMKKSKSPMTRKNVESWNSVRKVPKKLMNKHT